MKLYKGFLFLIFFIYFNTTNSMKFNLTIDHISMRCLAEYLSRSTLSKKKN